jgi:hypothetical protein
MLKNIFSVLLVSLFFLGSVYSEDNKLSITTKQGFVYSWKDKEVKNLTTFETVKTKKIDSLGKWNVLWDGWSIDAGFSYDSAELDTGAILLGRNFGTLGEYLPFDFPLDDLVEITLYPFGLYINDLFHSPEIEYCTGLGLIKFEIKF